MLEILLQNCQNRAAGCLPFKQTPTKADMDRMGSGNISASDDQGIRFRDCLGLPSARYMTLALQEGGDLDSQMVKMLREYKSGRHHQAFKRLILAKKDLGLDPGQRLVDQMDRLTETSAPLLIFELLFFMTGNEVPINDTLWRYIDTISCFDPDDAICHGAIYNMLIVLALRKPDLAMARRFCIEADTAYARCNSDYLRGFVQLHMAFVMVADSDLDGASLATSRAAAFFDTIPDVAGELAAVEVTRLWIGVERDGLVPPLAQLLPLRDELSSGALWPEAFLALAVLVVRAASVEDGANVLRHLGELESTIRIRGMTHVLPAMQLLREDHRRRLTGVQTLAKDHLGLPEDQLIMLLPDTQMLLTNRGTEAEATSLSFGRLELTRNLLTGGRLLKAGKFDQAAPILLASIERIRKVGWGWLARSERDLISRFCQECLARKRFVGPARDIRDTLLPQTQRAAVPRPAEFTATEFGLLQQLVQPRGNKLLAREMGVTEAAIKFHLSNIYRKMGVHSRSDAVVRAQEKGWISDGHLGL